MRKLFFFLSLSLAMVACSLPTSFAATRTASTATAIAFAWTKTAAATSVPTRTLKPTRTPTATRKPTVTRKPTRTPNLAETATQAAEKTARVKLEKLQTQALSVCQKQGLPAAPAWNQDAGQVNRAMICRERSCQVPSRYFKNQALSRWDPEDLSQLHLVVCIESTLTVLQRCTYQGTTNLQVYMVERVQEKFVFTTYAAQTGQMVGRFQLSTGMPEYCPQKMFLSPLGDRIYGKRIDNQDVFDKLNRSFHFDL